MITINKATNMVPHTCHLFLIIIIVAGGEEVSENKSWDIHFLILMFHHRNSFTIVPDRDGVGFTVGGKAEAVDELHS